MSEEATAVLLDCLGRAVQAGYPHEEARRVESAIADHTQGKLLTTTARIRLTRFLDEVRWRRDHFSHTEGTHADIFLRSLATGHLESRSSIALAIPPGRQPGFDILIHEPRESLERLYLQALQRNIGTTEQRKAIEKMLWLRPLDRSDYKLANAFLDELFRHGVRGEGTQLAQAHYLLDILSPDVDAHALVARLKATGLPSRLRHVTPAQPSSQTLPPRAEASLDDLLVTLSTRIREAADEGDTDRVKNLLAAVEDITEAVGALKRTPKPTPSQVFAALKGSAAKQPTWEQFDQLASHPLMNVALMPLGVIEHVLASIAMGELSWEESFDEMVDVLGGSVIFGTSIWGTTAALNSSYRLVADKRLGSLLRRISEHTPPKLRAYVVPALFLSAFTFIALRQSQELPLEEAGEYRWRFMEEMTEGFGVQIATTAGSFFGIRALLHRLGRIPKGKIGGGGVLALATGAGMFAQEIFASWRRRQFRTELKIKTYRELVSLLDRYPNYPNHLKPKLQTRIDRKLSMLIALNILDFPSVQKAIETAEARERKRAQLIRMGFPEDRAIEMMEQDQGKIEPLNETESKIAEQWIQKVGRREGTMALPVSLLPTQQRRIVALWEKDLSDVIQFTVAPIPIQGQPSGDWGIAHTMALLRRTIEMRAD